MNPKTKNVATIFLEKSIVANEKWLRSFSWKMTLSLGLSEPPCVRNDVPKSSEMGCEH